MQEQRTLERLIAAVDQRVAAKIAAECAFVLEVVSEALGRYGDGVIEQVQVALDAVGRKIEAIRSGSASNDGSISLPNL